MRQLCTLMLIITSLGADAQDLSKCEKLMEYQYHVIDSIPMSKTEIYHKVQALMAQWYPGYPAIIQMADSNSGMIMVSGTNSLIIPTGYRSQTISKPYNHRMKIECRENRLRIGIYYQTIIDEHSSWVNLKQTYPRLMTDRRYTAQLIEYEGRCESLQAWIDQTILDFRNEIVKPSEDW